MKIPSLNSTVNHSKISQNENKQVYDLYGETGHMSVSSKAPEPLTESNIRPAVSTYSASPYHREPSQALIVTFQQLDESTCPRQQSPLKATLAEVTVVP